jgi:hypothetical protein
MSSFTTDDGTGSGGTAVDAPPGQEMVVATLRITNSTDRPEPFAMEPFELGSAETLPYQPGNSEDLMLAVPEAQAAAFGIPTDQRTFCGTNGDAPTGYCDLYASVGAYSPAPGDITQRPQLAPGARFTVTLLVSGGQVYGQWVPANAPIQAVKAFVQQSSNCPGSAICWAALN